MANTIELIIRSLVEGNESIDQLVSSLGELSSASGQLSKASEDSSRAVEHFQDVLSGLKQGFTSEILKDIANIEKLREEFVRTGKSTEELDKQLEFLKGVQIGFTDELAKAAAEFEKLNNAAKEAGGSADKTGDQVKDLGNEAKEGGKGVEILNTAMTSFSALAAPLNRNLANMLDLIGGFGRTAGILGLVAGLTLLTKRAADAGAEMNRLAQVNGITVETLSALKVAAERNDASLGQLSIGLRTLNRQLAQAVTQGGAARKTFIELGITEQQLNRFYGDSEAGLEAVAKQITAAGTATEKTRLATLLFGRAGRELLPLLEEIANKGIKGLREEAEKAGLIMSKETAQAAKEFNDNLTALAQNVDAFVQRTFLPFIKALNDFVKEHPAVVSALGQITVAMGALALVAGILALVKWSAITTGLAGLVGKLGIGVASVAGLAKLTAALVALAAAYGLFDQLKQEGRDIAPDAARAKIDKMIKALAAFEKGGRGATVAAQHLREEIQRLTEILEDAEDDARASNREGLKDTFTGTSDAAKQLQQQTRILLADIEKLRAQSRIQLDIEFAGETGDINAVLSRFRANLEAIRKAELLKIDIQFEQDRLTTTDAAAGAARAAKVKQLNDSIAQQEADLAKQISQIQLATEEKRQAAIEARAKSEQEITAARIADEKLVLDLSVAQASTLEDIAKRAAEIAEKEKELIRARIASLEQQRNAALNRVVELDLSGDAAEKEYTTARNLTAEIIKQTTLLKQRNDTQSQFAQRFADLNTFPAITRAITESETRLDTLRSKLEKMRTAVDLGASIPFSEFLSAAQELDRIQGEILQKTIEEKEERLRILRIKVDEGTASTAQVRAAEAEIARLRNQAAISATAEADRELETLAKKIDDIAGSTAKNFVDRLIDGLEDGENKFKDFFKNMGRALFADLLQEGLKQGLKQTLAQQAAATGEAPADTLGGQFLQQFKFLFGNVFGLEFKKAADPLVTAGTTMQTAADQHIQAAQAWSNALTGAVGPNGVRLAGGGMASPIAPISDFQRTLDAYDRMDAERGAEMRGQSGFNGANINGFNSILPGAMSLTTGIGALTAGGRGASGILNKITGGLSAAKGVLEIIQALRALNGAGAAGQSLAGLSGGLSSGSSVAGFLGGSSLSGTGGSGIMDGIGSFFKLIGSFFGFGGAADGAMVFPSQLSNAVSSGAIRKFRSGGMTRGPVLGVIGEEGPEIVARMKPAGAHDRAAGGGDGDGVQQNIFLVDQRRQNLGPNDVELIIEDSIERGRGVQKAVRNVIKRSRR